MKKLRRMLNNERLDLWGLDECHFQQHGTRCRIWVPRETKDTNQRLRNLYCGAGTVAILRSFSRTGIIAARVEELDQPKQFR